MNIPNGNGHHQINIVNASHSQPSQLSPSNIPRRDLLDGGENYKAICVPLYKAITTNDFEAAKFILDKRPELVQFSITESGETIIHVAVLGKSCLFVKYLMSLMTKKDLELLNGNGETTLCLVARTGNVEIAKTLVEKNEGLIDIPNSQGKMPFQVAALYGRHDMVEYLYSSSQKMNGQFWTHQNRSSVFENCVEANLFDVAFQIVSDLPELAINRSVLRSLARKTHACLPIKRYPLYEVIYFFIHLYKEKERKALLLLRIILNEILKLPKAEIDDLIRGPPEDDTKQKYPSRLLFLAAEMGNTAFIVEFIRQYPHLALELNDDNYSIFHVAVMHRHLGIYNLLLEKDHTRDLIITLEDKNGNNILHLVGECAKGNRLSDISGLGMLKELELRWFKRVESILPGYLYEKKNAIGQTPYELFVKNHKDIFFEEEKLMKGTASQLMVVAALVTTISFAAIFTFPGGYSQEDTGIPIFLPKTISKIFIIFDGLSFLLSATSILMVIAFIMFDHHGHNVMTSSYLQIISSIVLVFWSIASIIITYLISLFILYQSHSQWIPILITIFAFMSYTIYTITNISSQLYFKSLSF
ncbi:ankyrin repeat-containing protein NPR4-like isoform X2 [Cynara cardunculus var. scolymus]|uniref:ankyrin repeat-containing protein NPR4-like isoform X2 n=1 Tax=Cynara cardunculus var. scolymus TaxID=59895 RepID=UPI000D623CA5|nr:ankyrin repeat-containing protein NPR4-like isoform X2 [Cynara cardunculus var. scolymus]